MIEQSGKVVMVESEPKIAWVQTLRRSACGNCSAKSTCGTAVLDKMSSGKASQTPVKNSLSCEIGDEVVIGIPDEALVKSAALVYLLPLITLLLGAVLAEYLLMVSEGWIITFGFLGLMLGFLLVKVLSQSEKVVKSTQPILLRKVHCIEVTAID